MSAVFSRLVPALLLGAGLVTLADSARAQGPKKSEDLVKITATADKPDADGKQIVTLKLDVEKSWHLYANPVGQEDLLSSQTVVSSAGKGKPEVVKVEYPPGKEIKDPTIGTYKVYEDAVTIKAHVRRAKDDNGPTEVKVKFQACNDKRCLLPSSVIVKVQ
jgi:hypothetical protein